MQLRLNRLHLTWRFLLDVMDNSRISLLVLAAWFGLLTGLFEALAFLRFPHLENPDLPWIAVLFALAIFLAVGLVLAAILRPTRTAIASISFVFAVVMFYNAATVGVLDHRQRLLWRVVAIALSAAVALIAWHFPSGMQKFTRRTLLWLVLVVVVYTGIPPLLRAKRQREQIVTKVAPAGAPNVLVIIVDTLRADHLSTYGYDRQTSPNLSDFASHGVLFRNAISAASWTLPSHASMMTGRLPHEHGADRPDTYLDGRFPTIAEAFSSRGYRTAAFSANWWLFARRLGFGRGFTHFQDFNSVSSAVLQTNLGQRIRNALLKLSPRLAPLGRSSAASVNRNILHWIDHHPGTFFIVTNYMDVHEPYTPPLNCFHQYSKLARPPGQVFLGNPRKNEMTPGEVQNEMDAYDASIRCMDSDFTSLLNGLKERGLLKNTVIVFTSDHGEEFDEHGLMSHESTLYREAVHVPLIMVGPGIPAGVTVDRPVSLVNLPATLSALSGGSGEAFPSPSLNLAWAGRSNISWPDPVSELAQLPTDPKAPNYYSALESVVTPEWQLIVGGKHGQELYHWPGDHLELHDVASASQYEDVTAALHVELQRAERGEAAVAAFAESDIREPAPATPSNKHRTATTPSNKNADRDRNNEYLKALGYIPD